MTLAATRRLYALLAVLVALVSLRFAVAPLAESMPHVAHYLGSQPLALWTHLVAGPLALALTPLQFSARLRARRTRLHRAVGRLYVMAALAGAASALAMLPGYRGSAASATGFALLALGWGGFTLAGLANIRAGRIADHRRWMLRSTAMAAAAITLRLFMAPLIALGWSETETCEITAWASWLVNLGLVELALRQRRVAA